MIKHLLAYVSAAALFLAVPAASTAQTVQGSGGGSGGGGGVTSVGNAAADTSLTIAGTGSGPWAGVVTVALNLGNAQTWSGQQTFVAPVLGTPASGNAVNMTGYLASALGGTALPAGIVTSSLTSVGTIGTGTWQGSLIAGTYGGTGVNNGAKTITLGASLTTTGAGAATLAFPASGTPIYTFPATTDTLGALGTVETWTAQQTLSATLVLTNLNTGISQQVSTNSAVNSAFRNSSAGNAATYQIGLGNNTSISEATMTIYGGGFATAALQNTFVINDLAGKFEVQANGVDAFDYGVTASGVFALPQITSDAGLTDATVCEDTTLHGLHAGSGTLGICLGTSSVRYKHDVSDLAAGIDAVMALRPKRYFLDLAHGDPTKPYYGFLAEDGVGPVPELIGRDSAGKPNTFDYLGLVPILVKALQEQQAEIAELRRARR